MRSFLQEMIQTEPHLAPTVAEVLEALIGGLVINTARQVFELEAVLSEIDRTCPLPAQLRAKIEQILHPQSTPDQRPENQKHG